MSGSCAKSISRDVMMPTKIPPIRPFSAEKNKWLEKITVHADNLMPGTGISNHPKMNS